MVLYGAFVWSNLLASALSLTGPTQELIAGNGHTDRTGLPHKFIGGGNSPGAIFTPFDILADMDMTVYKHIRSVG